MTTIAADTWGIPGPTFAVIYPVLIVAAAVAATVARRRVGAGREVTGPPPTATGLAYLRGGDKLAVAAALGALRAAGALDAQARPVATTLTTTKDPLQLAVLHALQAAKKSRQRTVNALSLHAYVRTSLAVLARDLADRGLVRTAADNSRMRRWTLLPWAVLLLGIARIVAGAVNGHPVTYVILETMAAFLVAPLPALDGGRVTTHGRAALRTARHDNSHLDPKLRPSWTTYGPVGAGLSVALFGPAAILLAEPAFAHTVAAKQAAVSGGGSFGDSGGSGCAGGSSCGGGGSSCGGGGGCGGGGCGG